MTDNMIGERALERLRLAELAQRSAFEVMVEGAIPPDILESGRRYGLETWVKAVWATAFQEGVVAGLALAENERNPP